METIKEIKHKIADQKGASAVEFAIILPLLVIFLFGIIEFSIMFYNKAMITNASREGARAGIVFRVTDPDNPPYSGPNPVSVPEIQATVDNYCNNYLITFSETPAPPATDVEVNGIEQPCTGAGAELIVTVSYHYDFLLLPGFISTLTGGTDIGAVTSMRCE